MGMVRGDLKLFFKQWTFLSNSLVDKISCKLFETVVLLAPVRNLILAGGGGGLLVKIFPNRYNQICLKRIQSIYVSRSLRNNSILFHVF